MQPTATAIARFLRRRATPAEQHLWRYLRDYQLSGHYFRRQYAIGRFVVDFACCKSRLVIEVDGASNHGRAGSHPATSALALSPQPLSPRERGRGEVQVDGDYHENQLAADLERAKYLRAQGFTLIRFTNEDVLHRTTDVLTILRQHLDPLPTPSPLGRGSGVRAEG